MRNLLFDFKVSCEVVFHSQHPYCSLSGITVPAKSCASNINDLQWFRIFHEDTHQFCSKQAESAAKTWPEQSLSAECSHDYKICSSCHLRNIREICPIQQFSTTIITPFKRTIQMYFVQQHWFITRLMWDPCMGRWLTRRVLSETEEKADDLYTSSELGIQPVVENGFGVTCSGMWWEYEVCT
jgi:hypothetical protein